jgi:hypothetical protein
MPGLKSRPISEASFSSGHKVLAYLRGKFVAGLEVPPYQGLLSWIGRQIRRG